MKEEQQNEARNRNLLRFVHAQDSGGIYDGTGTYAQALQEVRAGHKRGHWIWYVFPQMKGLGKSEISQFYGINGSDFSALHGKPPQSAPNLFQNMPVGNGIEIFQCCRVGKNDFAQSLSVESSA